MVKNLPAMWETWVRTLAWEDTLEKGMAIHSGVLAFHGQRSLAGHRPWGHKESDTTECLGVHAKRKEHLSLSVMISFQCPLIYLINLDRVSVLSLMRRLMWIRRGPCSW